MKVLFWIVAIALLFIAGFFAVANRELVEIDLWPVFTKVAMPLYLGLIGALCDRLHPRRPGRVVERARRAEPGPPGDAPRRCAGARARRFAGGARSDAAQAAGARADRAAGVRVTGIGAGGLANALNERRPCA